jgi:intraflagellar transport protein 46
MPSMAAASAAANDSSDGSDESEEEARPSGGAGARPAVPVGAYNFSDYKQLPVSAEIKELFMYIERYKPHEVELDSSLKCFIPDFIPSVGEMDAFIKVPPPDGRRDDLGLKVLDEPAAQQSDATVLELQLRAGSKKMHGDLNIRSIENAAKNPAEVERWIKSIQDLHKQKPSVEMQYRRNMPDLDSLMQEWPEDFEDSLRQGQLPKPEMDLSTEEYARVLCAIMDVPVYDSLIESLHVVFSLYMAFKENPHFAARSKENSMKMEGGMGGDEFGGADVYSLDESKY